MSFRGRSRAALAVVAALLAAWFIGRAHDTSVAIFPRVAPAVTGLERAAATPHPGGEQIKAASRALRKARAQARRAGTVRVARLASPAAKAERLRSRTAFVGAHGPRALAIASAKQPGAVKVPAWRGPALRPGERVVQYDSPYRATIKLPHGGGLAQVDSTGGPIAAPVENATKPQLEPLDLDLAPAPGGWAPQHSSLPVTLPSTADQPFQIGEHIRVDLRAAQAQPGIVAGDKRKVFYSDVATDTDAIVEPTSGGGSFTWIVRSPSAPARLPFDVGGQPRLLDDGTLALFQDGAQVGKVTAPVAVDAQRTPVATRFVVSGDEVQVEVDHQGRDVAYPISIDPVVDSNGQWAFMEAIDAWQYNDNVNPAWQGWAYWDYAGGAFDLVQQDPGIPHGHVFGMNIPRMRAASGQGYWVFSPVRDSAVFRAEYAGVRHEWYVGGDPNPQSCVYAGLLAPNDETAHWYATNNQTLDESEGAGPYHNCSLVNLDQYDTDVTVCANATCEYAPGQPNGTPGNSTYFMLSANHAAGASEVWATTSGAYVYHRDDRPPVINSITGLPDPNTWTNAQTLSATVSASDAGIGFCSTPKSLDLPAAFWSLTVQPEDASPHSNENVTYGATGGPSNCDGSSSGDPTGLPGASDVSLSWTEGAWPAQERIPDGKTRIQFSATDMLGNGGRAVREVWVDRTAPKIAFGGRLGPYLTEPRAGTPWSEIKSKINTLTGAMDLTVDASDARPGITDTSGVTYVAGGVVRLDPTTGQYDSRNYVPFLAETPSCARQTNCDPPATRIPPQVLNALKPGAFRIATEVHDAAGNRKWNYQYFAKGGGTLTTIVDGQSSARWVPIQAKRAGATAAHLEWTTGDSRDWAPIPLPALSKEGDPGQTPTSQNGSNDAVLPVSSTDSITERTVLDVDKLLSLTGATLVNDQLRLRAVFDGVGVNEFDRQSEDVAIRIDRGGRDTADATANVGPGSVDLVTGNLAQSSTDAAIDGNGYGISLTRSYSSRYVAKTDGTAYKAKDDGPLGAGWTMALPSDGLTSFSRAIDLGDPARDLWWTSEEWDPNAVPEERYPSVEIVADDGTGFVFQHLLDDQNHDVYKPETGLENYSLKRVLNADGVTTKQFVLKDASTGATATFGMRMDDATRPSYPGQPEHGTFALTTAGGATVAKQPTWHYDAFGSAARGADGKPTDPSWGLLPTRAIISTDSTVTCDENTLPEDMPTGCLVLELRYLEPGVADTSGGRRCGTGQTVSKRRLGCVYRWSPRTGATPTSDKLVEYRYSGPDDRLTGVVDARSASGGNPARVTSYSYDGDGLLTGYRAPGQEAWTLSYAAAGDGSDQTKGRLRAVSVPSLVTSAPALSSTVVYGARTLGTGDVDPWDLSTANVQNWGQKATPYRAAAVFGPGLTPGMDAASLRKADISYLDAMGRVLNHAKPFDLSDPVKPVASIDAVDYDKWGNVTRSLSPSGRAAAIATAGDSAAKAAVANKRASFSIYAEDGRGATRLVRSVGPERLVRQSSGTSIRGRSITLTTYDEEDKAPADRDPAFNLTNAEMPYSLPTKVETGAYSAVNADGTGGTPISTRVTRTAYQASTRQPTQITRETTGNPDIHKIIRDAQGREIERQQPGTLDRDSQGNTKTVYYEGTTTVPAGADPACYDKPAWAGLVCKTGPGAQATSGVRELPTKRVVNYDAWRRPTQIVETATTADGIQQSRTTTTTYDSQDRVVEQNTVGDGGTGTASTPKVGAAFGSIKHIYDDDPASTVQAEQRTGREVETDRVMPGWSQRVKRTFDTLGRIKKYADSGGATKSTTYDDRGRVTEEVQTKGASNLARTTYTYDSVTGNLTELRDVGSGGLDPSTPIRTSYNVDGRPTSVAYPSGVSKGFGYDEEGAVTRVTYSNTLPTCTANCTWYENTATRSPFGEMVDDVSTLGTRVYGYDSLGRLRTAADRASASAACTRRTYTFDKNSNRNARLVSTGAAGAACPATGAGTGATYTYDTSDRLTSVAEGATTVNPVYDAWGRTTTMPPDGARGKQITASYFVNDLAESVSDGTKTVTNDIDPLGRIRIRTTATQGQTDKPRDVYAYGDDSDEPMYTRSNNEATPTVEIGWTRYVEDPTGDVCAQVSNTGAKTLQVSNIRGDVVAEINASTSATGLGATFAVDEFGVPTGTSMDNRKLGFKGAKQRDSLLGGSMVSMGVRLYSPYAGRFLQTDPVLGGSANTYDYANQDPINGYDLDGRCLVYNVTTYFTKDGGYYKGNVHYDENNPGGDDEGDICKTGARVTVKRFNDKTQPSHASLQRALNDVCLFEVAASGVSVVWRNLKRVVKKKALLWATPVLGEATATTCVIYGTYVAAQSVAKVGK